MKKLMENWNQYIEEENEIFDSSGALVESNEKHQLNEIVISAIALATLGKVFVILFKALSAKKELEDLNRTVQASRLPDGVKETTGKTLEMLDTVERNAPAIKRAADVMGVGGNVNPLNWKQNALILVIKKAVEKLGGDQPPETSADAPTPATEPHENPESRPDKGPRRVRRDPNFDLDTDLDSSGRVRRAKRVRKKKKDET